MNKLLEKLAELEHEQWRFWATSIMETETISSDRLERWKKFMVPYKELDEKAKMQDRKWALRVVKAILEDPTEFGFLDAWLENNLELLGLKTCEI